MGTGRGHDAQLPPNKDQMSSYLQSILILMSYDKMNTQTYQNYFLIPTEHLYFNITRCPITTNSIHSKWLPVADIFSGSCDLFP